MDDASSLAAVLSITGLSLAVVAIALFIKRPAGPALDDRGRVTAAGIAKAVNWASALLAPPALFLALFVATFDWGLLD